MSLAPDGASFWKRYGEKNATTPAFCPLITVWFWLTTYLAKIHKHTVPPIQDFEVPHRRFAYVHADLVSMPDSIGCNPLLTLIDRFRRWPVAVPIQDITADTIVDAFSHNWVSLYRVPEVITTDRGSQFTSQT